MQGKDKFLNSSPSDVSKVLEREEWYHDYKIEYYKRFWNSLRYNPFVIIVGILLILFILLFAYYNSWDWKFVIGKSFEYGIVTFVFGVLQYLIANKNKYN